MKPLKIVIAVCAALGFIAVFLPYLSTGGDSMSLWDAIVAIVKPEPRTA